MSKGMSLAYDAAPAQEDMNGLAAGEFLKSEKKQLRKGHEKDKSDLQASTVAFSAVETRKAFADTAFFMPHLITGKEGRAEFTFKAPEQLTSWAVKVFSFTKGMSEGVLSETAVTKKDLMVRLDLPRFFREKDSGSIQVIVSNEAEKELSGELKLSLTENGLPAEEKVKLAETLKKFTVKGKGLVSFDWKVEIPEGVTDYKIKAVVVAGELSDAEERELPVLPSRERLIESSLIALSGTETGTLEIKLKNDPTRINEYMQVQVEPQLMLSVLNALPFLVDYPYECVEQTFNKFVPLAITSRIYEKYPEVKAAVNKLPKREGRTAPWDKEDPKRLLKLSETPWVWESEGSKYAYPVIDMFNPETVAKLAENKLAKMQKFQLPSGGYPWFDGGREDFYMTLLVLDGFAEARRYGVEIPSDMLNRALGYINRNIPQYLKAEESYLSLAVYAAYVLTSYPAADFPEAAKAHQGAAAWVKLIDENIFTLTPFGKAYLASIYFRLGQEKRANEVLDMALDGARENKISGVYWAPERYSWIWYSDSVEKHAFFLKTLTEHRPEDKRIKGMVQWLLFNKKGNCWKSTKSSAAAIYSILNYMNKTGALATGENFQLRWGKTGENISLKGDEFLEKPIRFEKKGFEITEKDSKAEIKKEGKGFAFASMTWIYSTDQIPEASTPGMVNLDRKFYLRVKEGNEYHLKPLESGAKVKVGDEIEVYLKINTGSQFEYMHLKDPKPAGFEAVELLSGWKYEKLSFYEEQRDSLTNFFMSRLPHGEFVLRYKLKPTKAGTFRVGAAVLQSMYAPDMAGHSSGFRIIVE
ncbi:MAG: alpha-2-macroglobulin family protein [Candidatus Firestonebacteria bacterium]